MRVLNTSVKSIKANTAVAPATALGFVTSWYDNSRNVAQPTGPDSTSGTINEVLSNIVAPPADEGVDRHPNYFSVVNSDNVDHTVTIYFSDGTDTQLFRALIKPNWSIVWEPEVGWIIYDDEGNEHTIPNDRVHVVSSPGAVLTDIVTVATNKRLKIRIVVCNIANNSKNFRIAISPLGAAIANSHYIYYDTTIRGNSTQLIDVPFELQATDVVRVYGFDANVSFTVNGVSQNN